MLPIFLEMNSRPVLVIGGGQVANRKVERLLRAGAKIQIVAPQCCSSLKHQIEIDNVSHIPEKFTEAHLQNQHLVFACADDETVNHQVATLARQHGILVNVADDPDYCDFFMPSIIDRSPVQIAISTGGASPILARLLKARLESSIPAAFGRLGKLLKDFRQRVKEQFPDSKSRRQFWEQTLQGPLSEQIFAGREDAARASLEQALQSPDTSTPTGEVYLVGAGPGDPDLLTFRALRLMQQADVVLYDRLVAPAILDMVRRDAERIHVGKAQSNHTLPQEQINELLTSLAKQGKRVLRLKGGDPFIFGRGGEEIELLAEQNIPFQVVPGITAAAGCATYAGIPLTHRDHAQACIFITGHLKDDTINLNWKSLVQPNQTVVVYMGLIGAPVICRELIKHGKPASTPIALIQQGTTEHQKVVTATLESLPEILEKYELKPPTLMIIGSVVTLRDKLAWLD